MREAIRRAARAGAAGNGNGRDPHPPRVPASLRAGGLGPGAVGLGPGAGAARPGRPGTFEPNAFLRIDADDTVTITVIRHEMGQGVRTLLPMMVAEELEADWSRIRVEQAVTGPRFKGIRLHTSGSGSSRGTYQTLRKAGAAAREMLVGRRRRALEGAGGIVPRRERRRRASRRPAAVPASASSRPPPRGARCPRTPRAQVPRAVPPAREADEAHRRPRHRHRDGAVRHRRARAGHGVREHRARAGARRAAAALRRRRGAAHARRDRGRAGEARASSTAWRSSPRARGPRSAPGRRSASSGTRAASRLRLRPLRVRAGPAGSTARPIKVRHEGDAPAALAGAAQQTEATYTFPFQAHAPLEVMNCTADVRADRAEFWAPTQTAGSLAWSRRSR